MTAGNYTAAYEHMEGYSTLGLENTPDSETAVLAYDALKASIPISSTATAPWMG